MKSIQLSRVLSLNLAIMMLGVGMVVYHLVYNRVMFQGPVEHQDTHLFLALMIVYLSALKKNKKHWPLLLPLILLSIITTGYIKYFYFDLESRMGMSTTLDLYIGILLLIVCFVAVAYAFGKVLPIVGLIFMAYTFLGHYLPDPFWHSRISLSGAIPMYNMGLVGMFGMVLGVSANYIFLFVVFGALLQVSGAGRCFIELGKLLSRRLAGGAGMTAVVSSALVGSTIGLGASNVAITGPFTIPMMKAVGYTPEQAGGIETAASAGSSITPPVMGIVAFVMAEYTGIPYIKIVGFAIIPAILYYFCIGLFVQLNALKMKVKRIPQEVDYRAIRLTAPLFVVPLAVLIVLLLQGYSLMFVSSVIVVLIFLLSLIRKETRGSLTTWVNGCVNGATLGAKIAVTCSVVGVIMASVGMTGLGLRFPSVVEALSGGVLPLALLLAAAMMIILGCGVPPFTAYMIGALLVVPLLVKLGLPLIPAHFFMLYYAVFALITPPVALTALVAAPIAGASYMKTSFQAVRAGMIAWFLPFMMVMSPGLLLQPQEPVEMVTKLVASIVTVLFLQVTLVGYYFTELNVGERGLSTIPVVALLAFIFVGNYILFATGLIASILLTLWQLRKRRLLSAVSVGSS